MMNRTKLAKQLLKIASDLVAEERTASLTNDETLYQLIDSALEGMSDDPREDRNNDPDPAALAAAEKLANTWDEAVINIMLKWLEGNFDKTTAGQPGPLASCDDPYDVAEVLETLGGGAGYLYFMEAGGDGVGTWDGRWDAAFKSEADLKALSDTMKKKLSGIKGLFSKLEQAIDYAAYTMMSNQDEEDED